MSLFSSDAGELQVPSSVLIPANRSSASFVLTAVDDSLADGPQQVAITAQAVGYIDDVGSVTVTDLEELTLSIDTEAISELGGVATATLTRHNNDIAEPLLVGLRVSDGTELTVPVSVTIPGGETSVSFSLTSLDDALLDGPQAVTVVASTDGYAPAVGSIVVVDHETLTIQLSEGSVSEDGVPVFARVSRSNTDIQTPVIVRLSSDHPDSLDVLGTVFISSGASESNPFLLSPKDNSLLTGDIAVLVTAESDGYVSSTEPIVVRDHEFLTIELSATSLSEFGEIVMATISRSNTNTDEALFVALATDDVSEALVDATIEIPIGERTATFEILGVDDELLDGSQDVLISASAAGYVGASRQLQVTDHELLSLVIEEKSLSERQGTATAIVTRSDSDTLAPLTVTLHSSDTTEATVPASIVIPAGSVSAVFTVTGVDDSLLDGTQQVVVTAHAIGYVKSSDAIDVTDYELLSLAIDRDTLSEGCDENLQQATRALDCTDLGATLTRMTVTRRGSDVAVPLTVHLSSSDKSEVVVPFEVTILAGQLSVTFDVEAVDDQLLDGTQAVDVSALASGFVESNIALVVEDAEWLLLSVADTEISENGGRTTVSVVQSNTNISDALVVSLSSSDESEATVPVTVTIAAGESSASFEVVAHADDEADGAQAVFITAAAVGYMPGEVRLDIADNAFPWHNLLLAQDVNDDGVVSPLDALIIINDLNVKGARALSTGGGAPFLDVSRDGVVAAIDVLQVINFLNNRVTFGEGEASTKEESCVVERNPAPDVAFAKSVDTGRKMALRDDRRPSGLPVNTVGKGSTAQPTGTASAIEALRELCL